VRAISNRESAIGNQQSEISNRQSAFNKSAIANPQSPMSMPVLAIYPGSFDPITMGHVDIIQRGSRIFDRIVIAVLANVDKAPLFTVHERVEIAKEVFQDRANVEVDTFDGLLVEYARRKHARVIVRGLRAVSDFEYEMQMALMNHRLNQEVETVFMMPAEPYTYVSSRLVKEVVALGGSVKGIVPDIVERRLREKKLARETLRA
jgi:pantetheine-phosphate adenylyltransferase